MHMRILALLLFFGLQSVVASEVIRVGLIGLDTSHVIAFSRILNDPGNRDHVPGAKIVAAFKGGSPDIASSWSRVDGYTKQLQEDFGVKIVDTIEELCTLVDAIMLTSVDGRPHLEQVRPVMAARKPVYIDKPLAGSLRDAIEILRLAHENNVPCFSTSSLRYYPGLVEIQNSDLGDLRAVYSYGPAAIEPTHPDLFWYGVHAAEALFTLMGTGCQTVMRMHTPDTDIVTGAWDDGKVGVLHGIRNYRAPFRVTAFGTKAVLDQKPGGGYGPMVAEIVQFFQTGVAPVSPAETIELFAFMEAADESKRRGGVPVKLDEVIKKNWDGPFFWR
jgi:predicted dehydrogenase